MKQQVEERHLRVGNFMSSPVVTVRPETAFVDAIRMMILKGIGNLVVAEGERVDGIITERELLQYLVLNKTIPNKQVKYILTKKFTKLAPETSILEAAKTMISKKTRLLVFRKDKRTGTDQLTGIVTASDIVRAFFQTDRNPSIESAMTNRIFTLKPTSTILAAAKIMLKKGIGSVVATTNGPPYAIFTERDLLNRVLSEHVDVEEKLGAYCTHPLVTAKQGIGAKDAAKIMLSHKIKRLPLTKGKEVVAMVTARDLVEAFQRGR
ncbi:MAG TPA: CBS domain-containing protein [Nitrososphaera sp.]|nr:CBS domain-containing protein [Nitrososphaera sp.]